MTTFIIDCFYCRATVQHLSGNGQWKISTSSAHLCWHMLVIFHIHRRWVLSCLSQWCNCEEIVVKMILTVLVHLLESAVSVAGWSGLAFLQDRSTIWHIRPPEVPILGSGVALGAFSFFFWWHNPLWAALLLTLLFDPQKWWWLLCHGRWETSPSKKTSALPPRVRGPLQSPHSHLRPCL